MKTFISKGGIILAEEGKKEYSRTLLAFAANRRGIINGTPAFGEKNTKQRVKHILTFKKPALWLVLAASAGVILVAIFCLTDTPSQNNEELLYAGENPYIGDAADSEINVAEVKNAGSSRLLSLEGAFIL